MLGTMFQRKWVRQRAGLAPAWRRDPLINIARAQYADAIPQANRRTIWTLAPVATSSSETPVLEVAELHARGFVLGGILALGLWVLVFSAAHTVLGLFQL